MARPIPKGHPRGSQFQQLPAPEIPALPRPPCFPNCAFRIPKSAFRQTRGAKGLQGAPNSSQLSPVAGTPKPIHSHPLVSHLGKQGIPRVVQASSPQLGSQSSPFSSRDSQSSPLHSQERTAQTKKATTKTNRNTETREQIRFSMISKIPVVPFFLGNTYYIS